MTLKCVGLGVAPSALVTLAERLVRYEYDRGEKIFQEQYYNLFIPSRNYKNLLLHIFRPNYWKQTWTWAKL